jgi:hypothetical protein
MKWAAGLLYRISLHSLSDVPTASTRPGSCRRSFADAREPSDLQSPVDPPPSRTLTVGDLKAELTTANATGQVDPGTIVPSATDAPPRRFTGAWTSRCLRRPPPEPRGSGPVRLDPHDEVTVQSPVWRRIWVMSGEGVKKPLCQTDSSCLEKRLKKNCMRLLRAGMVSMNAVPSGSYTEQLWLSRNRPTA